MNINIPEGSTEIQTGLFAKLITFNFNGEERSHYNIYSADGYCFYDKTQQVNNDNEPENEDENKEIKQTYARVAYTPYKTIEELNEVYVSVPIKEEFEIV